jgi:hypothetical protein
MTIRSRRQRADKDWIAELSATDERRAMALEDLSAVLITGLLRVLGNRSSFESGSVFPERMAASTGCGIRIMPATVLCAAMQYSQPFS